MDKGRDNYSWYRTGKAAWCVWHDGKRVRLNED